MGGALRWVWRAAQAKEAVLQTGKGERARTGLDGFLQRALVLSHRRQQRHLRQLALIEQFIPTQWTTRRRQRRTAACESISNGSITRKE